MSPPPKVTVRGQFYRHAAFRWKQYRPDAPSSAISVDLPTPVLADAAGRADGGWPLPALLAACALNILSLPIGAPLLSKRSGK